MTAAAFRVVVASPRGEIVLTFDARTRAEADELLGRVMGEHLDCEVTLYIGDVVVLSAGPVERLA